MTDRSPYPAALSKLIAEIDALESRATQGPWTIDERQVWWAGSPYYRYMQCAITGRGFPMDPDDSWEVCAFCRAEEEYEPDEVDLRAREGCKANAALITALRNNWPALRARLLAQQKVVEAARWAMDEMDGNPRGPGCSAALRTALSAIDAEYGKGEG